MSNESGKFLSAVLRRSGKRSAGWNLRACTSGPGSLPEKKCLNWSETLPSKIHWIKLLVQELERASLRSVDDAMHRIGITATLEEAPELIFENLRRSATPDEDAEFLRDAGV